MGKINKIKLCIFIAIRLSIILATGIAILEGNWKVTALAIITLIVMLLPSIIERRFHLDLPEEFEIVLALFIYAGIYLGEVYRFYDKFWFWDKMLHSLSGLILGNIGFLIVSYLNSSRRIKIKLSPVFVAFFSFCFAVAMGTVWEIYEYTMDKSFGFFMQRGSLDDTMVDLILDTAGALIFAVLGYFQETGRINFISRYLGGSKYGNNSLQ